MIKTTTISGFCPYFNEEITVKASFIQYNSLSAIPYPTPEKNMCQHHSECGRSANPDDCPVFNQVFLWNEL